MSDVRRGDAASVPADATWTQATVGLADSIIGSYRLLERVGEGGMGEVWLSEQLRPMRRHVALKIIKAGLDTAQVIARFEAERQALALMDHPAIARIFDAGSTEQGRPYFAMEFVRGDTLTAYCDRYHLPIRNRLALFIQVCEGVQHAHQKGIIHRDLKPSNILVMMQDDHPVPKIIDFGVAKAISQPLTERTLYTALGGFIGTPEYMSPEQAEMGGVDIDTRTDVYALGVLLYELLTGVLPFDQQRLQASGFDELRRTIREVDPPTPSARVTQLRAAGAEAARNRQTEPARLTGLLRRDLDWITMKALAKDRRRRYSSASDLAADIRRHLAYHPVLAGPPSAVYRSTKFIRRHRLGVAITTTLVVMLLGFSVTMAIQIQRVARERDRANREAETAQQVSNFLLNLFAVSDPSEARGNTLTARELLDKGARDIEQRLADQPQTRARLETTIGKVYIGLGLYAAAEPLLKRAFDAMRNDTNPDTPEALAATGALADVYWYQGRYPEAGPLYVDLVQRRQRLLGPDHPDTLKGHFDLASLYLVQGRMQDAEQLHRQVLHKQKRVLGTEHIDTLASMNNLGVILHRQQRYAEELPVITELAEVRRRTLGASHPDTLRSHHGLASTYSGLGRYLEAERLFLSTIGQRREVLGDRHPATLLSRTALARMYEIQRRYPEAEQQLLAVAHALQTGDPGSPTTTQLRAEGTRVDIADRLSRLYKAWGKSVQAAEWSRKNSPLQ